MDTASVRERGTAAPALGTVSLSLESFPALERALPLAVLLLWIPVVALAQDQLLYLGLCSICMTVNIALSRVVSLLPASARVPLEVAKNAFGMLFVALVPILWESGVPVWLAAIPSLIRLAAIMPLGRATQLLMPGHVLAAVLGVGLAAGSVAPALLPACALSAIALLNLLVVGQMQRSLRTSAVRSACIQQSGDLFYQVSPDGYILDCNEVVLERLGCTREELMGRSVVTLYDEESQEKSLANVETVRREGSIKDVEMTVVPFEGEPFPVLLSARVLLDQDGSPLSTVSIQRDVSQLEARGRELRAALLQAERAASVKGDFLATMSHEIRTPMNGVLGMLEILLDGDLDADQTECAEIAHSSAISLLSIIDDVLDLSSVEAGKLRLESEELDLEATCRAALAVVTTQARQKGLDLVYCGPERLELVTGDAGRLRQVLVNLLGNAVKFTDEGEIRLSLEIVEQTAASLLARFLVEDTGIGVPAEFQAELFEPFTQGDASTTRKFGGTGLGLAICQRLVELMGGEIGMRDTQGGGTCFAFTVRLARRAEHPLAPLPAEHSRAARGARLLTTAGGGVPRLLLAEDSRANQAVAVRMLEKMGCQVELVEGGAAAVAAVERAVFDVVLMDCQMPGMDGYQAAAEIRSAQGDRAPTIVALTAHAMQGERERCLAAGMDDYLAKPFTMYSLGKALQRALSDSAGAE